MFSSGGGKVMGTDGTLRLIRKLKPDDFIGIPTFVYHVLHQAAEEGLRWENLRCIVLGGEKVSDGLRQKLRDLARELGAADVDVLATYGFTEAKWPGPNVRFRTTSRPPATICIPTSASLKSSIRKPAKWCRTASPAKLFSRRSTRAARSCCAIAPAISLTAA